MYGQKQINDNIRNKFLANDKILESLALQLEGFNSVIKNQLNFNELIETKVTQLASLLGILASRINPQAHGYHCSFHLRVFQGLSNPQGMCVY